MVFSSLTFFIFFLPITLIFYFILPKAAKNYWLLIVSLFFYAWGAHEFVLVMIISIFANYVFALLISVLKKQGVRKLVLVVAVIFNIVILFYNKYMNFATSILRDYLLPSIEVTEILLPIGISFFTFQAMSYVIDVYRGDVEVQKNPYYLGLYIAFFPQLIAGPIVRYHTIVDQIENRTITLKKFSKGVSRFMIGFSQKILLSNMLAIIADSAFSVSEENPSNLSVGFAWLGAVAYTLQIFFDFAGYSSMAIGLGKMFGFEFMENFDYPYISKTITEFWRRWHISLGQWFRDYVYIPLGGSRVDSKWKLVRNLFVVWTLTGIWHGAKFTFVVWGLGYFALLTFEKLLNIPQKALPKTVSVLYRVFTLLCIVFGWVVFRANGLHDALGYFYSMFGLSGNALWDNQALKYLNDYKIVLIIAILCCTPIFKKLKEYFTEKLKSEPLVCVTFDLVAFGLMLLSISSLVMGGHNPFIYFNF